MGGGLMQLVAYGAQDIYLTGNPQITFFKVVYRRHTNFAMEAIEQTFSGVCNFGNKVSCTIARNGDLVHRMYLEIDTSGQPVAGISSVFGDLNRFGHKLIKSIEVDIGGQTIDKHYGEWLEIWSQLTHSFEQLQKLRDMIDGDLTSVEYEKTDKIYIPLQFWFNKNPGLALPLIALQYHEVKVNIEIETFNNCTYNGTAYTKNGDASSSIKSIKNASLWCDYVFLDTDERKRFAQLSHEYLIEQVQLNENGLTTTSEQSVPLTMNHPVKELIWTLNDDAKKTHQNQWYNYTNTGAFAGEGTESVLGANSNILLQDTLFGVEPDGDNSISSASLQLNGNDRFAKRTGEYFSLVQPYQHHTNIPSNAGINVYSFAVKPEEHQPSGTLNMSRIDTARLVIKPKDTGTLRVWGVNYNVLRILSGMGGLAYSN